MSAPLSLKSTITFSLRTGQDAINSQAAAIVQLSLWKTCCFMFDLWSSVLRTEGKLLESLTLCLVWVFTMTHRCSMTPSAKPTTKPDQAHTLYTCPEGICEELRQQNSTAPTLPPYLGAAGEVNYGTLWKGENPTWLQGTGKLQQSTDVQIKVSKVKLIKDKNGYKL